LVIGFNINSINSCIDVTTATAALLANTPAVSSVVTAGKFKVTTPDVSAPVFISTILKEEQNALLFGRPYIKVKAFALIHSYW
jgi:hypothetical protein